jgi:hypothetical protein
MAIDFAPVRTRQTSLGALVGDLSVEDLARATDESIRRIEEILAGATDADVVFVPQDPLANDPAAANPDDVELAWTLGHVVVHVTASAEESAALAAELARGVPMHGRSRWEVPWQTVTAVAQCRRRLAESRRIRLASLQMWPETPPEEFGAGAGVPTRAEAKERFARGLSHEDSHVEHLRGIVAQARAARSGERPPTAEDR